MRPITFIRLGLGLLAAVFTSYVVVSGLNRSQDIEKETSSFTQTKFDYLVTESSPAQVEEFSAKEFVASVFPVMNFANAFPDASGVDGISLFAATEMTNYEISFFAPGRLIRGTSSTSGIMLDQKAAAKLNVNVGEQVSLVLAGKTYQYNVSGIYKEVTYRGLDNGIALIQLSEEIESSFATPLAKYDLSFIQASDVTALGNYLKDYIPRSRFYSKEAFAATLSRPSGNSDLEWEKAVETQYEAYVEQYESTKRVNAVQLKSQYLLEAEESLIGRSDELKQSQILFAILIPSAFTILYSLFIFLGRGKDEENIKNGVGAVTKAGFITNNLSLYLCSLALPLAIPNIVGAIYGGVKGIGFGTFGLVYSLPFLASAFIVIPLLLVYANMVFGAMDKIEKKEAPAIINVPRQEEKGVPKEEAPLGQNKPKLELKQKVYFDLCGQTIMGQITDFSGRLVYVKSKELKDGGQWFPLDWANSHFHHL